MAGSNSIKNYNFKILFQERNTMNKPYFNEKQFFIFTLFFILITSTHSSVQSNTEQ